MALLSHTARLVRRLGDPERPVPAVAAMVLGSLLLLASVLTALPSPAEGSDTTSIVDAGAAPTSSSSLLQGPTQVVLPEPDGDAHEASVLVNHLAGDVTVDAKLANGDGLRVELSEAGARATAVRVVSERVHVCGRYAGSLILEATHASLPADLLVLDVRFAECGEHDTIALAPDSVHDVAPTWADEGRAPWKPVPLAPPSPATPTEPTEPAGPAADTASPSPDGTTEPASEPTATSEPSPTETSTATSEPSPTSSPSPTSEPSPTSSPSPTSEPTTEPTSEPTSSPSPTSTDGDASPSPSETSTTTSDDG